MALLDWFAWFRDPIAAPTALKVWLQHYHESPSRLLPTPNITGTMRAFEIGKDLAEFGVYAYTPESTLPPLQGANVSIVEIQVIEGGNVSIKG